MSAFDVIIYHNPACGTSRNTLALIRNAGIEPHIVEYLKTPPSRALLENLCARAGLTIRDILRKKAPPFAELGLDNPAVTDDAIYAAIAKHPVLIERPIVVSPKGVRLCRPAETALEILPAQRGEFFDESGERRVDEKGRPVRSA
jgi:arsenate reductase (glutaredoxin)